MLNTRLTKQHSKVQNLILNLNHKESVSLRRYEN